MLSNKWRRGIQNFALHRTERTPVRAGCSLQEATFDSEVGKEWYLYFGEEPPYASQYPSPIDLFAHIGAVNSPHGVLGFIAWQIAANLPQEVYVEQWLNINNPDTFRMLGELGSQTHLKLVIVDVSTAELTNMIEFENNFGFESSAPQLESIAVKTESDDFDAAKRYIEVNYTLDQLLGRD